MINLCSLSYYVTVVTSLFYKVFLFNICLMASSSASPEILYNKPNKTFKNCWLGFRKWFCESWYNAALGTVDHDCPVDLLKLLCLCPQDGMEQSVLDALTNHHYLNRSS